MTRYHHLHPLLPKPLHPTALKLSRHSYRSHHNTRTNSGQTQLHASLADQLSNCNSLSHLAQIHARIIRNNFLQSNPFPIYWNNLIRSYTRTNAPRRAVEVYLAMARAGVSPDWYTLPIVLNAVGKCCSIGTGMQVQAVMIRRGLERDEFCESGLISMYCKAGEFGNARKVFDGNTERKLGSWNAMIGGLSQDGRDREAVDVFLWMKRGGFMPDEVTMVCVMVACGSLRDLGLALQLHKCVFQAMNPIKGDVLMMNSLIDVYGKCGRMDLACRVFNFMDRRNVSSWTSMIVGYALHGYAHDALHYFHEMRTSSVVPNQVTFLGVLSACVHSLKVEEGKKCFQIMKNLYGIQPQIQHFGCMVDLLGKAGLLEEARAVVEGMPMRPNVVIWGCFLGACERYSNVEMGEWVAKHLLEQEPWNDGVYVVLSNMYACRNMWHEVGKIREIMKQRSLAKTPALSS